MEKKILVEDYNPLWPRWFQELNDKIWPSIRDHVLSMEHVGSTSVPGLSAKPVIDIDIVIENPRKLEPVIQALESLGYLHRGNLGIEGREAFRAPSDSIKHHLYVCTQDCVPLKNHLYLREHLLQNPADKDRYGMLKKHLANTCESMDEYIQGKTHFIVDILKNYFTNTNDLMTIRKSNESVSTRKLVVNSNEQTAQLWDETRILKTYKISTAAYGLGCEAGSHCTPSGKLRVASKIGSQAPPGTIFKGRIPTGEIWSGDRENPFTASSEDLILTRILWLTGAEQHNANTFKRYIYLHGTNHENLLGTAASHGCVRFSNKDIIDVFDQLQAGSIIEIH